MTTISVRLDDQDKRDLDALCDDLGITISTFYSMYTKKALREWKIPFEVSASRKTPASEELEKSNAMLQLIRELNEGRRSGETEGYTSAEDVRAMFQHKQG